MRFDMTEIAYSDWTEEGILSSKGLGIIQPLLRVPEIIEISQIKESRFEIFTINISKLYQNNLAQDTMVKLTKLWQEWTSQYNTVKTAIFGEKRHDKNYGKRL